MIWMINGKRFKENFQIYSSRLTDDEEYYRLHNPLLKYKSTADKFPRKNVFNFSWNWCRKSWSDAQRHVFIDFGDENLFWVTDGMRTRNGKGTQVSKKKFLLKYGGNLELIATLNGNSTK